MSEEVCTVAGCGRTGRSLAAGKRVCLMHYKRWKRHGDVDTTAKPYSPPKPVKDTCGADGCAALEDGACGYCKLHMTRVRRHGDPHVVIPPAERAVTSGPANPHWTGDEATYSAVHQRVRVSRGRAADRQCIDCGRPASQWSYDRLDPNERQSSLGPYSVRLDHYQAKCVPCHKSFDMAAIASARK